MVRDDDGVGDLDLDSCDRNDLNLTKGEGMNEGRKKKSNLYKPSDTTLLFIHLKSPRVWSPDFPETALTNDVMRRAASVLREAFHNNCQAPARSDKCRGVTALGTNNVKSKLPCEGCKIKCQTFTTSEVVIDKENPYTLCYTNNLVPHNNTSKRFVIASYSESASTSI